MHTLLVGLTLLMTANGGPQFARDHSCAKADKKAGAAKTTTPAVDPNAMLAKSHGGKVWIVTGPTPNAEGAELGKWLDKHPPKAEIKKEAKDTRWSMTYIAVFKKPPARGPATVQFVDKKEPGTLVDQYSTDTAATSVVFQEPYDLDTNNGFNKDRTYIIRVGQIIKNKFVTYATGEVSLK